jgi:RHS repeat-associated protein
LLPGLDGQAGFRARITEIAHEYEIRSSLSGRVITILPQSYDLKEWETTASTNANGMSNGTPSYVVWGEPSPQTWSNPPPGAPLRHSWGSYSYDDYGNLLYQSHQTQGGVVRTATHTYENRTSHAEQPECQASSHAPQWLLGLETSAIRSSHTSLPPNVVPSAHPVRIVRSTYDCQGNLETVKIAASADLSLCSSSNSAPCETEATSTTFTYNARGNLLSFTTLGAGETAARTAYFAWDAEGVYRWKATDGFSFQNITLTHPALGVPILITDELGVSMTIKPDGFGRTRRITRPGIPTLERAYAPYVLGNRRGIVSTDVLADGSRSSATYDEIGRPIYGSVLASDGTWIHGAQEYNAFGRASLRRRPTAYPPSPSVAKITYDRLGRTLKKQAPDGTVTSSEHTMFSTTAWDPEKHETYVHRDVDGRVIASGHRNGTDEYGELKFAFGQFDQVEQITDANANVTTIQYDLFGQQLLVSDGDTGTTSYTHNGFGELKSQTTANSNAYTWEYDILGRMIQATGPDGVTTYAWDVGSFSALRLSSMTGADGVTTEYKYDMLGRRRQMTETIDGTPYTIDWSYDTHGRLTRVFYPKAAGHQRFTIGYRYNANGYLQAIDDRTVCGESPSDPNLPSPTQCPPSTAKELWRVDARDIDRAVKEATFGNGRKEYRTRDPVMGRMRQLRVPLAWVAYYWITYDYWDDGNLKSRTDLWTSQTERFFYDSTHRLTDWDLYTNYDPETETGVEDATWDYTYDELGNLFEVRLDGSPVFNGIFGQTGPHRLDWSSTGGPFAYDLRGRQETGGGRSIAWSQYDLPRDITTNVGTQTQFKYDAAGNRARKQVIGGQNPYTTIYVGGLYERRIKTSSETHAYFVYGETGLVAQVEQNSGGGTARRYVVTDPLGSVVLVLNENGYVLERSRYAPFGSRVNNTGQPLVDPDSTTTLGFTGHEEEEGNLINMRGRIYDRAQYRFLTPDPIVQAPLFGQSHNPYSYVLNNPLRYADPTGFQAQDKPQSPDPDAAAGEVVDYDPDQEVRCWGTGGDECRPQGEHGLPLDLTIRTDRNNGSAASRQSPAPRSGRQFFQDLAAVQGATTVDPLSRQRAGEIAANWGFQTPFTEKTGAEARDDFQLGLISRG